MSKKSRTKRKPKQTRSKRYTRERGLYSKGGAKGKFINKVIKSHIDAGRASGPIFKKAIKEGVKWSATAGKWTAKKMKNATASASVWFGNKVHEGVMDWYNQSDLRAILARYNKEHQAVLGLQKKSIAKDIARIEKVIEPEGSIRKRLSVPAGMELSEIERIYDTIKSYFKRLLGKINNCDDIYIEYKSAGMDYLADKVIFHIDQTSTPIKKTIKIKDALHISLKKLTGKPNIEDFKDSHPLIKLLLEKSKELRGGLIEEAVIISWLASIPN